MQISSLKAFAVFRKNSLLIIGLREERKSGFDESLLEEEAKQGKLENREGERRMEGWRNGARKREK
jgi:hypothetical protein